MDELLKFCQVDEARQQGEKAKRLALALALALHLQDGGTIGKLLPLRSECLLKLRSDRRCLRKMLPFVFVEGTRSISHRVGPSVCHTFSFAVMGILRVG